MVEVVSVYDSAIATVIFPGNHWQKQFFFKSWRQQLEFYL